VSGRAHVLLERIHSNSLRCELQYERRLVVKCKAVAEIIDTGIHFIPSPLINFVGNGQIFWATRNTRLLTPVKYLWGQSDFY